MRDETVQHQKCGAVAQAAAAACNFDPSVRCWFWWHGDAGRFVVNRRHSFFMEEGGEARRRATCCWLARRSCSRARARLWPLKRGTQVSALRLWF